MEYTQLQVTTDKKKDGGDMGMALGEHRLMSLSLILWSRKNWKQPVDKRGNVEIPTDHE
jgi:hypothetical protein